MIHLITGLPGAGKSLWALAYSQREFSGRPIYYDGIADLKLPWIPLEGGGANWQDVADGSVVLIDEAQRVFRPRGPGAQVPAHVAALETHRHRGIDIVLVTQHPKLIDSNVRRLAGRHMHVVRAFGTRHATVHEWGEVKDDPERSREDSIRHEWRYPAELFGAYKSAEVHTVKRRLPVRLLTVVLAPIFAVAGIGYGVYSAYDSTVKREDKITETVTEGVKTAGPLGVGGMPTRVARPVPTAPKETPEEYAARFIESRRAAVAGLPHTAPAYADVTRPRQAPEPAACVATAERCVCYSQQATRLPSVPDDVCRQIVAHGYFRDWADPTSPVTLQSNEAVTLAQSDTSGHAVARPVAPQATAGRADGPRDDMPRAPVVQSPRIAPAPPPPLRPSPPPSRPSVSSSPLMTR